jgi:hypothetical protein
MTKKSKSSAQRRKPATDKKCESQQQSKQHDREPKTLQAARLTLKGILQR